MKKETLMSCSSNTKFELLDLNMQQRSELFSQQESFFQQLRGKILTIIEATITNESQLKAIKDLIHNEFNQKIEHEREYCFMNIDITK